MADDLLSLKWNNHKPAFFNLLRTLREKGTHADITLACGSVFFDAHQLVLVACSKYFSDVLSYLQAYLQNPKPLVVMKDVDPDIMAALLDYMYLGEVDVPRASLPSLIKVAETLKIKGLAIPDDDLTTTTTTTTTATTAATTTTTTATTTTATILGGGSGASEEEEEEEEDIGSWPKIRPLDQNQKSGHQKSEIQKSAQKSGPQKSGPQKSEENRDLLELSDIKTESVDNIDIDDDIENGVQFIEDGSDFHFLSAPNMRLLPVPEESPNTVLVGQYTDPEQYLTPAPDTRGRRDRQGKLCYSCPFCERIDGDKSKWRRHIRSHTGEKPFKCSKCPYRSANGHAVRRHQRVKH